MTKGLSVGGPKNMELGDNLYYWRKNSTHHRATGVCFRCSEIRIEDIYDGASNTYLAGEKFIDIDEYATGNFRGDDRSAYQGADNDVLRWTADLPMQDCADSNTRTFGSAHSGGWNAVFCDGSVHFMSYDLDLKVHRANGNRKDVHTPGGDKGGF